MYSFSELLGHILDVVEIYHQLCGAIVHITITLCISQQKMVHLDDLGGLFSADAAGAEAADAAGAEGAEAAGAASAEGNGFVITLSVAKP